MKMEREYTKRIEYLAKPFIELGLYDSPEKFLRDLIKVLAKRKMKAYERTIKRFENKHKMSFEEFTEKLEGKATPELEKDWMEWEAAINMHNAWKKASQEIDLSAT